MSEAESSSNAERGSSDEDTVALVVNAELCIGVGQCELLEPDTFAIDDDTATASVVGDGRLPADRAAVVIERCPAGAISIAD